MPGNNEDASSFMQDVTRSVDQLCTQMALANVNIPKFNPTKDVFDFLTEFEMVTSAHTDQQRFTLLAKAFPSGHLRLWYEAEIKPAIVANATWSAVRSKIVNRFSDVEDRDRHFAKLRDLKFDADGSQRLLDFVEDLLFSYARAFPTDTSQEARVRYVKAAIPASLKSTLGIIPEYQTALDEGTLKRAVKQFDSTRGIRSDYNTDSGLKTSELATLLKDLVSSIRQEGETTRKAMLAGMKFIDEERAIHKDAISYYHNYRPRERASPNRQERRSSPNHRVNRSPSPQRGSQPNRPGKVEDKTVEVKDIKEPGKPSNHKDELFDRDSYYSRFGRPPSPCDDCGYNHWRRHCVKHLN